MVDSENVAPGRSTFNVKATGRLLILVAAVMWSTSGFFAKSPLFAQWPQTVDGWPVRGPLLAFWRAVFATLVLLPFVRRPRWTPKLIPMTLNFAAMNFTFLNAMTLTTEANAIWLQHTAPFWVFLVSAFIFREAVDPRDWWLLLFIGLGVAMILAFEIRGQASAGVVYGVFGGLTYGGVVLSLRYLRNEDGAWLVALNHLVTALIFAPYVVRCDIWPDGKQFLYLAAFGMFQMGLPYLIFARGLRYITGHEASGIVLLEPILVPVWVYVAWSGTAGYELPRWWTMVGASLILVGLLLRYFRQGKPSAARQG